MSNSATLIFPGVHGDQVPAASRPILEQFHKSFGFVPNLFAALLNSPILLEGYLALDAVYSKATLNPAERQLVLLTASVVNECAYCAAAHSTVAKSFARVVEFLNRRRPGYLHVVEDAIPVDQRVDFFGRLRTAWKGIYIDYPEWARSGT